MASRTQPVGRRSSIALAMAALAAVVIACLCVDVIPEGAVTPSAMGETSVRIEMYYQQNKRLPPDLGVLPVREGYANRTTDAWGRLLIYTVDADDAFTLSSLGEDGAAGGRGDNADLTRKYWIESGEIRGGAITGHGGPPQRYILHAVERRACAAATAQWHSRYLAKHYDD